MFASLNGSKSLSDQAARGPLLFGLLLDRLVELRAVLDEPALDGLDLAPEDRQLILGRFQESLRASGVDALSHSYFGSGIPHTVKIRRFWPPPCPFPSNSENT